MDHDGVAVWIGWQPSMGVRSFAGPCSSSSGGEVVPIDGPDSSCTCILRWTTGTVPVHHHPAEMHLGNHCSLYTRPEAVTALLTAHKRPESPGLCRCYVMHGLIRCDSIQCWMLDGDGHDQPSFVRVYSPSLCLCFVVVLEYCSCSSPHHQTLNSPLPQLLSADRCPFAAFLERSAALQ